MRCNTALGYSVVNTTETLIGYNAGYTNNPTVTLTFSHNIEQVTFGIRDLDLGERLISMIPTPDDVYDEDGFLSISGNSILSNGSNVTGDLIYNNISNTEALQFTFDQQMSNLALTNLQFSVVPEPATLALLTLGTLALRKRKA